MADFDAFDRMSRTLRGANPLPPGSPMASVAQNLRQGPMAAPVPTPSAYDTEVTQRAKAMAEARRAAGGTNAAAGPTQTQIPHGNTNLAGQQMGTANSGRVVPPDTAASGGKTSRLGAVKNFAAGGGASNGSVGGAFKSVAGGVLRGAGRLLASPVGAAAVAGSAAYQGFNTDTEQYAKRFGLEDTEPGVLRDVGIRALGVASDVGNNLMMGAPQALGAFRDKNDSGNGPAPTTPNSPTPTASGKSPLRPVNRMGQGFDDPRRTDRNPARPELGPLRDFTKELASVPANLPTGLREGVIHKTVDANGRTVYSGKNVGLNPQMVDGAGRDLEMRGSVTTAPAGSNVAMTDAGGGGFAFAGALRAQDVAKAKAMGGRIGEGGNVVLPGTDRALTNPDGSRWTERDKRLMAGNLRSGIDRYAGTSRAPKASDMSPGQQYMQQALNAPRTLRNLTPAQMSRIQAAAAQLDNQAADRAVLRESNQMSSEDRRYQADAPLKAKQAEMELAARQRQAQADLWKQAGGDPRAAAELAAQAGLDPEKYTGMEKSRLEADTKARENTMAQLNNAFYTDGPKGERIQDKETAGAAYEYLNRVTGGRYESLPELERSKYFDEALTRFNLVQGANARRKTGPLEQMGWTNPTPAYGDLPTDGQLKGGVLREAGVGVDTIFGQPDRLDYRLTTPGGAEMYLPKNMTQAQLKYLAERGVQLPK